jgi:hypothetical protein
MIRSPFSRRVIIAMAMFLGLFSQFQVVFACELMDGKTRTVCCCDERGDMSMGCAKGGGCQDQAPGSATSMDCCEVSYRAAPNAKATPPGSAGLQVLLLDAPQPPPIPVSFTIQEFSPSSDVLRFTRSAPPRVAGTDIYLLTNRFRI